jgi:hypothetical protein
MNYQVAERVTTPLEMTVGAWVSRDLAQEIAELAHRNERSVSGEIRVALRRHLAVEGASTA